MSTTHKVFSGASACAEVLSALAGLNLPAQHSLGVWHSRGLGSRLFLPRLAFHKVLGWHPPHVVAACSMSSKRQDSALTGSQDSFSSGSKNTNAGSHHYNEPQYLTCVTSNTGQQAMPGPREQLSY